MEKGKKEEGRGKREKRKGKREGVEGEEGRRKNQIGCYNQFVHQVKHGQICQSSFERKERGGRGKNKNSIPPKGYHPFQITEDGRVCTNHLANHSFHFR